MKILCAVYMIMLLLAAESKAQLDCNFKAIEPDGKPRLTACINGDCNNNKLKVMMSTGDSKPKSIIFSKDVKIVEITVSHKAINRIKISLKGASSVKFSRKHPKIKRPEGLSVRSRWDAIHEFSTKKSIKIIIKGRNIEFLAFTAEKCSTTSENGVVFDVAIIGGGPSGSYAAWKIAAKHPSLSIGLFEADSRIGGRARSIKIPEFNVMQAEMGPMRLKEEMTTLREAIADLGLTTIPFTTPTEEDTLYFLRGQALAKPNIDTGDVPFQMTDEEKELSHSTTELRKYWNNLVLKEKSLRNDVSIWEKKCKIGGNFTYEKGAMNAYLSVTKRDVIDYVAYRDLFPGTEYFGNENYAFFSGDAADPESVEFRDNTNRKTARGDQQLFALEEGFEELPKRMIAEFLKLTNSAESGVFMENTLVSVDWTGSDFLLVFAKSDGEEVEQRAKQVLLTASGEAMKIIEYKNTDLSEAMMSILPAVSPIPAMKTFMAYDKPWWHEIGNGAAFDYLRENSIKLKQIGTDLPVGTILDYGQDPETGKAILLSYREWWNNLHYWQPFFNSENDEIVTPLHLQHITSNLAMIFNVSKSKIPEPYFTVTKAWFKGPIWKGWHQTTAGYNYQEAALQIKHPVPDIELYVAGSAFPEYHGWIDPVLVNTLQVIEMMGL